MCIADVVNVATRVNKTSSKYVSLPADVHRNALRDCSVEYDKWTARTPAPILLFSPPVHQCGREIYDSNGKMWHQNRKGNKMNVAKLNILYNFASSVTKSIKLEVYQYRAPDKETFWNLKHFKFSHVFKTHIGGSGDSIIPSSNTFHLSSRVMYSTICCDRWVLYRSALLSYFILMHSFINK